MDHIGQQNLRHSVKFGVTKVASMLVFASLILLTHGCESNSLDENENFKNAVVEEAKPEGAAEGGQPGGQDSLTLTPATHDFGAVSSTAPASLVEILIRNDSKSSVYLTEIGAPGNPNFQVSNSDTCPVGSTSFVPGASCFFRVAFKPVAAGSFTYRVAVSFDNVVGGRAFTKSAEFTGKGVTPLIFAGLNSIDPKTVTTTKVKLVWPSVDGASTFHIFDSLDTTRKDAIAIVPGGSTSYTVQNLVPATNYGFRVAALNELSIPDGNTVVQAVTTDSIGTFAALQSLTVAEGATATTANIDASCTDSEGNKPTEVTIVQISDTFANCSIDASPFKVRCTPAFKTGHTNWTSTVKVGCLLNDYPIVLESNLNVTVTDTNRAPVVSNVSNQTVLAGVAISQIDVNGTNDFDADLDAITYACYYQTGGDGSGATTLCTDAVSPLRNLDNSPIAFDTATGVINWTPRLNYRGPYGFKIVGSDGALSGFTTFTITVNEPPASPLFSTVAMVPSTPSTQASDTTRQVTFTAMDAGGNSLPSCAATIAFTFTGGGSTAIFESQSCNPTTGVYTAQLRGNIAGSPSTIGATINGTPVTTALPTLQITPGSIDLDRSLVSVAATEVASSSSVNLTLLSRDKYNNVIATGGSVVTFKRGSSGAGVSNGTFTAAVDNANGAYSGTFTGTTAGTATLISATIGGVDIRSTLPSIRVNPGSANPGTSTLALNGASTVASGTSRGIIVTTYDANSNRVTSGGATVVFSATGGASTGTFGATVDNNDGTYSTNFTGVIAGTPTTISATLNGGGVSNTQQITVTPGSPSLSQSTVSTLNASIASGATTTLRLQPRDAASNAITAGGITVSFNKISGTSTGTIAVPTLDGDGTYYSTFTGVLAGTAASISATMNGSPITSTLPTIAVTAGAISPATSLITASSATVASGSTITATLMARDAAGNTIATGGSTVVFSRTGGTSTGSFGATSDNSDGTYSGVFTGVLAGTPTGLSATIGGQPITTPNFNVTVTPGAVNAAGSGLTIASSSVSSGNSVAATVQAKDAAGNTITTGGATLVFAHSGGTSTGTFTGAVDNGNGTYTSQFSGLVSGSATTVSATINSSPVTQTRLVTVSPGAISPSTSTVSLSTSTVLSGQAVTATMQAKDSAGNNLISGGATITFFATGGSSTISQGTVTDVGDGTYTAQISGVASGTSTNVKAAIGGTPISSTGSPLTVSPGAISPATSVITVSASTVASGSAITVNLQARDAANNIKISGGSLISFSTSGGVSTGAFGTVNDLVNGNYTATFTGLTSGSATFITSTINGVAVSTPLPTVAVLPGTISTATSQIFVSAANIPSGTNATLTLVARDANNNAILNGGQTVVFTKSGGTSTGTISGTSDVGNGTYTALFAGILSGTPTTINATINASAVTDSKSISVSPGAISTATSITSLAASSVASGQTVLATLQAVDAAGNNLATGGASVTFIASGGLSTVSFGATSDLGDGRYQSTVTAILSGTTTSIKGVVGGTPVATAGASLQVTPGSISTATSLVSASSPTVASGSGVTLTLTAKDAAGNNLSTGGSTVTFALSGGTSTGSVGSTTDVGNGTYTAVFTGINAGSAKQISGLISGVSLTTTAASVAVVPGPMSPFTSTVSVSSATVQSGSAITLTLSAKDAANNTITVGGQTVAFSNAGGGSTGTISGTNDLGNGSYTASFTGVAAGSSTIVSATINATPVSDTKSVTVLPGAISANTSAVSLASGTVTSGSAVLATLQGKDAAGNNLVSGGSTVVFFGTGGTSTATYGSTTDLGNGQYQANVTGLLAGSATSIKATIGGTPISTSGSPLQVTPGAASLTTSLVTVSAPTVIAGSQITVTLTAKDAAGNSLSTGGRTVVFSKASGTSTGAFGSVTDNNNGTYSANFTGQLTGTAAGITATIDGGPITTAAPTVGVLPGPISVATSTMSVSASSVLSGSAITLTLQSKDANSNLITAGGHSVVFTNFGGTSTGSIASTVDVGNGTYTATFTGNIAGSPTAINATINGSSVTTSSPTVAVTPGAISPVTSVATVSVSSVASGQTVTASLQAKDSAGNNLLAGGATVIFFGTGGTSTVTAATTADLANGVYQSVITGVTSGSISNIKATIGGTPISTSGGPLTVLPGTISTANSALTVSSTTVASGSSITVTLQGRDAANNLLTSGGSVVAFATSGGLSTGAFGSVTDLGTGSYTASFSGLVSGTATQITGTINGTPVTSTLPSVAVVPGPISTSTSQVMTSSPTIASGANATLTLVARDANNNVITAGGQTILFANSGGTSTGTVSGTTDVGNGTYTASFQGIVSGTPTTISATINASAVSSTTTVGVGPGAISTATSVTTLAAGTVNSGQTVLATLQAKDAAGNSLVSGGATVTFIATGGISTVTFGSTTDVGDGRYQAVVTGVLAGSTTAIKGVIGGTPVATTGASLQVNPGVVSTATSVVVASASTVASGAGVTLTLTGKDAAGNTISTGGSTITFNAAGGTSTGAIGSTTDVGNGTYTATFTGITAGSPTQVTGLIGGVPVGTAAASIAVLPGSISTATSTINVSSSTVQSGNNVTVTLTAKDANSNLITTGGHTIAFAHSGGISTGSFAATTDVLNGTYTSVFTGLAAGSSTTITATINASAVTASTIVTVTPGAASATTSIVTLSAGTVSSGSNVTATLQSKDAAGNNLVIGGAAVTFFATGGTSTATYGVVTDLGDGRYQAAVTGVVAGTATTIKGTVGGTSISTSGSTLLVTPGVASATTSLVSVGAATVASGANVTLTLTAKDAAGNSLAVGGRTVVFSKASGSSTGVFGSTTDNSNGTYTALFTGLAVGTPAAITATVDGSSVTTTLPTVAVVPGSISTATSQITSSSPTVASGSAVTLTLQAKDANNNTISSGSQTVVFSRSGGSSTGTISGTTDVGDGTYTATFTGTIAGTGTNINATINAVSVTSGSPLVTVSAGPISAVTSTVTLGSSTVASGSNVVATIQGRDAAGNLRSTGGDTVVFTRTGGTSTGTFATVVDNNNGTYSSTITGVTAGTATSIGGTIAGVPISSTLPTLTVLPGTNSQATSTISVSSGTVASNSAVTLTLQARDASGNALTSGGLTVAFNVSGGGSSGIVGSTTDNLNGTYSTTFTGVVSGSASTVSATIDGSPVTSTLPTVTVVPGPISVTTSLMSVSNAFVASGSAIELRLNARDVNNNVIAAGGGTIVFSYSGGSSTGTIGSTIDDGNGTYRAPFTGVVAGTTVNISSTIGGTPVTTASPQVTVQVGPVSLVQSTVTVSSTAITSGNTSTLTLTARDSVGNTAATGGQTVVFSRSGGTSSGSISATTDNGNGTYTATFTGSASGSATNIGATIGGSPITSTAPQITVSPGAISTATSILTVGASSVASGASTTVTLQARDSFGNALSAGGATVTVSAGGGSSTGSFNAVADNINGTYSSTFTGITAGNATIISASIGGTPITSTLPTITVIPGIPSSAQSTITVSAGSVASGQGITLTLTARDANGNASVTGGRAVSFSRTGGTSSGSIGSTTDNNNGTYTAVFTGTVAGTATTINASLDGSGVTTTLPTVTVTPGAVSAATSTVAVSSATIGSGATSTLTLQARDTANNAIATGGLSVVFSRSGGSASGTISSTTDNINGTYTATFTGTTAGSATTISATIGGSAVTTTLPTIAVNPGAIDAATSTLIAGSSSIISGSSTTLSLQGKDAFGNNVSSSGATITFSVVGGSSTGTFGSTTDNLNGTYSSSFTGVLAGTSAVVSASVGGTPIGTTLPTIIVNPGIASPATSVMQVSSATVGSGSTITLTLLAKDAAGNSCVAGGRAVAFSHTGGTSTGSAGSSTDNNNGSYTALFTGTASGSATSITASINGSAVTTTAPTVTVTPGSVSVANSTVGVSTTSSAAGSAVTLTVVARDTAGNPQSSGGLTVVFTRTGGTSNGTISSTTDNGNGTYTASFSGTTSGSATTIGATIGGSPISSTLPTITVTPGTISTVASTVAVGAGSVASGASTSVSFQAKDVFGNNLLAGGATITFAVSNGTSTGTFATVADNTNGTYTSSFTGVLAGTAATISASITGTPVTTALPTITVTPGPAVVSQSLVQTSSSTVASGSQVTLSVVAKDAAGNFSVAGGRTILFTTSGGTSTGSIGSTSDLGNGTYTALLTGILSGSATTINATLDGTPISTTLPSVSVTPGSVSVVQSTISLSSSTLNAGGTIGVTLQARDNSNNVISTGGLAVLFSRSGGTSNGSFATVVDNGNGTYSSVFTGTTSGSATSIGGTIGGSAVTSTLPQATVSPGAISTTTSTLTVGSSSVASGSTTVAILQARDAYSNIITAGGATVTMGASGGTSTGSLTAVFDNGNGTYSSTFTGINAGNATVISASISATPITTSLPTITVTPGTPSPVTSLVSVSTGSVASGQAVTLTLTTRDASNNPNTTGGRTVVFSSSGGVSTGNVSSTTDNNNGTYTATFTGVVSGTATTITALLDGTLVSSTLPTVTVTPGNSSTATSTISVSSGSISSGGTSTLNLLARDAANNPITTGGLTVVFSRSGGSSSGTISSTTDNNNGSYTATFTGTASGSATTISATIGGTSVSTSLPTITVSPGAIDASTSTLISGASSIISGNATSLTIQAKDAFGNNLPSGGATVTLAILGGSSTGTFGSVTDNSNGTYSSTFTGVLAGTPAIISASIGGTPIGTTLPTITVTPGIASPTRSIVSVSSSTVASGNSITLTLTGKDIAGNNCSVGGRAISFSNSGGSSTGTPSGTTDNGNGTYTASFTGDSSGSATSITASINGSTVTTTLPTVTVTPGSVSVANSTIGVSSSSAAAGSPVTLTLTARDTAGNIQSSGGLTVVFNRSGGTSSGSISSTTDNGNGTYTATFSGTTSGSATTIGGTISGSGVSSTLPTITVTPGSISTVASTVSVGAGSVASGASTSLTFQAKDTFSNNILIGGASISFSITSGTSTGTFGAVTDNVNGTYSSTFTGVVSGSPATISASVGGTPITSALPTITVNSGPAVASQSLVQVSSATVQSAAQITLTVVAKDASGNFATTGGRTVLFTNSTGTSTGTISGTSDLGNGTYTASFTGSVAGTATTIGATLDGTPISTTLPTVTVTPGSASVTQSLASVSSGSVAAGSTVTVTLTTKDAAANNLSTGGLVVAFSRSGGVSNGTFSSVTDNGNGTYSSTFTGTTSGTATTISATIGGAAISSTLPTVAVTPGPFSLSQSVIQVGSGSISSGANTTLTVVTKDTYANFITSSGLTIVFGNSGGTSTGSISATTDNLNGTYSAAFTGAISGSATTIGATINAAPITSTGPTVTVVPGTISASTSVLTVSASAIASNSNSTLTMTAKDANSNLITSGGATVLFNRSGGTSTGTISGTTDNGNGTYTATFTGVVAGTPTTIGATVGGTPVSTTLPTIAVSPGAVSLANSLISITGAPASVTSGSSVGLTLTARDVNNNQMSSGGRTVVFTSSSGGGVSTVSFGSVTDNGNGTYSGSITGVLAGTAVSIGATIDAASVTSTLPSLSVTPGTFSATTSTVAVASGNVNSGSGTTATVTVRDAAGNQFTAGGLTVTFNNAGGTSTGSFGSVTDNVNGTYSVTFTGIVSGTATTINGSVGGTPISSTLPTVTVNPGPASAVTTTVALSASTVAAGSAVTVTIQAKDSAGNNRTSGGATVVLNNSAGGGESTGSFTSVIDNLNGTYSSTFTGDYAGTVTTIIATINGSTITTTMPTITVVPGPVSTVFSVINVSSTTLLSGNSITATLIAKDARSNQLPSGGLTVAFNNTGGTSTGSFGSVTDNNNGTYTTSFTGVVSGSATTMGATIGGSAVTSAAPNVTVNPGAISYSQSSISLSSGTVVSASQITAMMTTRDAAGNTLGSGGRTVVISYGGGSSTVTFGAVVDNANGTYSAPVTGILAGTATSITGTINAVAVTSTAPTLQVVVGSINLATSTVSVSSGTVPSGSTATLTLQAKDVNGNNLTSGTETVVFSRSGGTSTGSIGTTTIVGNGTYTAIFTAITMGTATNITATVNAASVTSASPTITVIPGVVSAAASTIVASAAVIDSGTTSTITVTARDANGNQQSSGGLTIAVNRAGGTSTGSFSTVIDVGDGTYTSIFTGVVSGTATNIGATIGGSTIAPTVAVTVNSGPLSLTQSTVAISSSTVASGSTINVTVVKKDAAGNSTTQGSSVVVLNRSGGTSTGNFSSVTNVGSGTFTATFTGITAGTAATIGAQVGGSPISSSLPTITVIPGAISLANSLLQVTGSPTTLVSGSNVTLTVTARDSNSNTLATGGSVVAITFTGGTSTGTISAPVDNSNGTYSATFTGIASGTPGTFGSTIDAAPVTNTMPTLQVTPGAISAANSSIGLSTGTVASGATSTITVSARDANNNLIAPGGHTIAFSQNSGTSTGSISSVTDNTNGTYTATLTAMTAGTSTTLGATINGLSVSSALPTFLVTPGPFSLSSSLVTVSTSSTTAGSNVTLTLTTRDAGGNQLSNGGQTVVFTRSGGVSNGTISATSDPNSGIYTAIFASTTSGTATTIGATINSTPVTSTLPTITVNAGAFAVANSIVSASTAIAAAGTVANLLLTSYDSFDNAITSGSETVVFTKGTGSSDGTISGTTNNGNGTYSATFTAATKGTARSIGATVGGSPITKLPLPTITVNPATLSLVGSLVSVGTGTLISGNNTVITLTAKDDYNNVMNSGGLTVLFNVSGGASTASFSSVTDNGNGTYTATATGVISGSISTYSATIGGSALSSSMPTLTVTPGPISQNSSIVTVGHTTRQAGLSTSLTLTARDAAGNLVGAGGSTVVFNKISGTSTGSITAATDNFNGTYSATFTANNSGTAAIIGATIGGAAVTTTLPGITVTPGPHSLAQSTVTRNSATTSVGGTLTFMVTARDAFSNQQNVGGLTILFGLSGGNANGTIDTVIDNGDGTYSAIFTGTQAGTNTTITATINGSAITNILPTISVDPPVPSPLKSIITLGAGASSGSIASGSGILVTLTTRDTNNLLIGTGGYTVVFNHSSGVSTGSFGSTTDVGDGTYTATFTGIIAGTATNIGANISGGTITGSPSIVSTLPTVTVVPGSVSSLTITAPSPLQGLQGFPLHQQPIVSLKDPAGNICNNDSTSSVTLAHAPGSAGGVINGNLVKVAVSGIADYSGRGVGFANTGNMILRASIGATTVDSATIPIVQDTISLTITTGPTGPIQIAGNLANNIAIPTGTPVSQTPAQATQTFPATIASTPSAAGITATGTGANPTGGAGISDITISNQYWNLLATRNTLVPGNCSSDAPYAGGSPVACQFNTPYSITYIQLLNAAGGAGTYSANDTYISSNTLPTTRFLTERITDIRTGNFTDAVSNLTVFNNALYFTANRSNGIFLKIFKLVHDGAGNPIITQVTDTRASTGISDAPAYLTVGGNRLYFRSSATGQKLFYLDTSDNVVRVSNMHPSGTASSDLIFNLTWFNSKLYIQGQDMTTTTARTKFAEYDPTAGANGTIKGVVNLISGATDFSTGAQAPMTVCDTGSGSRLYFVGYLSSTFQKIFEFNGTTVTQISNTRNNNGISDAPTGLTCFNNQLFFSSANASNVAKVHRYNGTTVTTVSNTVGAVGTTDAPAGFTVFNNRLYFVAQYASAKQKLYYVDTSNTVVRASNMINNANDQVNIVGTWNPSATGGTDEYLMIKGDNEQKLSAVDVNGVITKVSDINSASFTDNPIAAGAGVSYKGYWYFDAQADQTLNTKLFRIKRE